MNNSRAIQEVDVLDIIKSVGRRNKKIQAMLLQEIEKYVDKSSPEFEELRKFILDEVNGYTRGVLREIFGDVEFMMKA